MILSTEKALAPVENRAKQMGIIMIDDIANYSLNELKQEIIIYSHQICVKMKIVLIHGFLHGYGQFLFLME